MTYKELLKDIISRLTSRKMWAAIAASVTAYELAGVDGLYSVPEILTIIGPLVAFIGVEGAADTMGRSSQPVVNVEGAGTVEVQDQTATAQADTVVVDGQPTTPETPPVFP